MWPFNCKAPEDNVIRIPDNPFISKFPIGSEFSYMGVRMCVTGHYDLHGFGSYPLLRAEYFDKQSRLCCASFNQNMIDKLSRDNP